jgi:peptide/nickel transport system ATP-binding protein
MEGVRTTSAATGDVLLEITGLEVAYSNGYRTVCALNGIDLSLGRGEVLGLVGETGAGKTTTALSVMRLLPERTSRTRAGRIVFGGRSLLELGEKAMQSIRGGRISMIFQDPMTALNPVVTVGRQVEEVLVLHNDEGLSRTEIVRRVEQALEAVGIDPGRRHDFPHQFSGGMKQRVVIAMALAASPELLIADEPTTALDVTVQAQVLDLMAQLIRDRAMAMLLITHDLGVAATICDQVAVLYCGEVVEVGSLEALFSKGGHHPYTQGLFGSIPDIQSDERRLHPIEGALPDPSDLPTGCSFHPRCPRCVDICASVAPETFSRPQHAIRCHLFSEGWAR